VFGSHDVGLGRGDAMKWTPSGIAALVCVAGCGGLSSTNGGDAGTDRSPMSPVDSGPMDSGPVDAGTADRGTGHGDSSESGGSACNPPSCAASGPGMTNCGAGSECCCTSLEVTGGTYSRTYSNSGSGPTDEADPATVSSFRLDEFDVTVGRFRQFVNAWNGAWLPAPGSGKHGHLNGGLGLARAVLHGS
jgi:sulfatase modifying factor 1